jgi:hypothetical protein
MNEIATRDYDALDMVDDPQERLNIGWLASVCRDIAAAPRRVDAIKAAVAAHPTRLAYGTLKNDFMRFRNRACRTDRQAQVQEVRQHEHLGGMLYVVLRKPQPQQQGRVEGHYGRLLGWQVPSPRRGRLA